MSRPAVVTPASLGDNADELNMMADSVKDAVYSDSQSMLLQIDSLLDRFERLTNLARSIDVEYILANAGRIQGG
jgi:hypothetical protein